MPRLSEMPRPGQLTGLELVPALQGGGPDGNVGVPLLLTGAPFGGAVLVLRAPMTADLAAVADGDPGAGSVRWNNASPAAATELFISDEDGDAGDIATILAALQVGGFVYVQGAADSEARDNLQKWQVTSVAGAAGYTKVGVAPQADAGAFVDGDALELTVQQPLPAPGVDRNLVTVVASVAGMLPIDVAAGDYHTVALAENIAGWTFTNVSPACSVLVKITQDATPRTVVWPASFRWAGGTAGEVSTGAGAVDLLALSTFDGGGTWLATLGRAFS